MRLILIILFVWLDVSIFGQEANYVVEKTSFSSDFFDEFAPAYFKRGLVFCTNRSMGFSEYSNLEDKSFFKLFYVTRISDANGQGLRLFSKDLKSKLNDGPAAFNQDETEVYFSRNLFYEDKPKNISGNRSKLGIYHAIKENNRWRNITEFKYNNKYFNLSYNVTTPCLSPDGNRLYFASDKPGGFGGSDIYCCIWNNGEWEEPVNLGPVINTAGNEAYPFINKVGDLLFSSDGHGGMGGKDIYVSRYADTAWLEPVGFDPPINSIFDDFAIVEDSLLNKGYFSSSRDKSIDIYFFRSEYPQIFFADMQKENNFCFVFNDSSYSDIDTSLIDFKWYLGEGKSAYGNDILYCFQDTGQYKLRLDLVDKKSGKTFFTKSEIKLKVRKIIQPYILSSDYAITGESISFTANESYLPGFTILKCLWDFGDGDRTSGETVIHNFKSAGDYKVKLDLTLKSIFSGQLKKQGIYKLIHVTKTAEEQEYLIKSNNISNIHAVEWDNNPNTQVKVLNYLPEELYSDTVFAVEVASSTSRLNINDGDFKSISKDFLVKEFHDTVENRYSYYVYPQLTLMSEYPVYIDLMGLGYDNIRIKTYSLQDTVEKELFEMIHSQGNKLDLYFDVSGRLTANAYIMMDKLIKYLKAYPTIKLEIQIHTDNTYSSSEALKLTQQRAQQLANYLISRGISQSRLIVSGFGSSRPVSSNLTENGRMSNRRIEFQIRRI